MVKKLPTIKIKHKRKVIACLVVVLIVAGSVAGMLFFKNDDPKNTSTPGDKLTAEQNIAQVQDTLATSLEESEKKESIKKLAKLTNESKDTKTKELYSDALFDSYLAINDLKAAQDLALVEEKDNPTYRSAEKVAIIYSELKDYQKAAEYYQKAADRSEKVNDPKIDSPYNDYINLKKEAEAKL